ncbi:hypothetical protein [Neptuniibacter caesariensis]|uniref:Uncharacterized protein n=1 Tax=Neptuniibacter caesariensis TaxID=207954 RepID=A0A7U8GQ60_NEPCE|nr:hypothetical protein [Neptuniibacter caesariensis]EAR59997.1 hypothetical protein MED92_14048 [Oceanospirillum sp. MED92] [Neptuniibacter caesariensis]
MAETENPRFNKNHTIDLKQIRLDVYRLVCYFEAARSIAETHASQDDYAIEALPREFFTDEVSRILLQTAIILRMLDDESEADIEERDPFFSGRLEQNGKTKQLSLREACNKIIHSHKINFDQEHFSDGGAEGEYFTPIIYLYGRQKQYGWKATLNLRLFLNHAARLLRARSFSEFIEWERVYGSV